MALIFKFPTNKKLYSDKFIKDIKPNAIGDFSRSTLGNTAAGELFVRRHYHDWMAWHGGMECHNYLIKLHFADAHNHDVDEYSSYRALPRTVPRPTV